MNLKNEEGKTKIYRINRIIQIYRSGRLQKMNYKDSSSGFALLEVLIALAVVSILISSLLDMSSTAMYQMNNGLKRQQLVETANNLLEVASINSEEMTVGTFSAREIDQLFPGQFEPCLSERPYGVQLDIKDFDEQLPGKVLHISVRAYYLNNNPELCLATVVARQ